MHDNISNGFFAFNKPAKDRLLSNWFLYSEKNNYIIKKWKEKITSYWNNHKKINHYFRHHYIFGDLYNNNNKFKNIWDLTPKISADGPHFLQKKGLLNTISDKVKNHIDTKQTPLYKLTYKYDVKKYNNNSNLAYLLNSINLQFIHIPKTGGSSIEDAAYENNIKWGRKDKSLKKKYKNVNDWHTPQKVEGYSFCVIRNPYDRFISEFYHRNKKNITNLCPADLNRFIETIFPIIRKNINYKDNHFLQQYKFYKFCDIAISFDNLQDNINKLTDMFNLPTLKLGKKRVSGESIKDFKKMTKDDINDENKKLIDDFYRKDFELYDKVKEVDILIK